VAGETAVRLLSMTVLRIQLLGVFFVPPLNRHTGSLDTHITQKRVDRQHQRSRRLTVCVFDVLVIIGFVLPD